MTESRFSGGLENGEGEVEDRESTKELRETLQDDRYVHYLDCVDGFTVVCIHMLKHKIKHIKVI